MSGPYRPREPRATVLYPSVATGWPQLQTRCAQRDRPLPGYIEEEIERYLRCGILEHGFARVHCSSCGFDRLVPFSCQGRGFCPSCHGRFAADRAAHLVDHVLPSVPLRQWVLSLPQPLRYLAAYDTALCSAVLACLMRSVFSWLRHTAKAERGLKSVQEAYPGAVTAIQRCGSALNLNLHYHTLVPDGVFILRPGDISPHFAALPAPSDVDIAEVAWDTCLRVVHVLRKRGQWLDDEDTPDVATADVLADDEPGLAALAQASVSGVLLLGPRAGKRSLRLVAQAAGSGTSGASRSAYGFNLHAGRRVSARDKTGREQLCRYVLRPPLSHDRLERMEDGRLRMRLKTPWRDGTTHLVLTDLELVQKLVPLVWPPRFHRLRFHGVFAPNAKLRRAVVPLPVKTDCDHADAVDTKDDTRNYSQRKTWADLMARVFSIDVLACPKCESRMQRIAFITTADAIRKILDAVGHAADSPVAA